MDAQTAKKRVILLSISHLNKIFFTLSENVFCESESDSSGDEQFTLVNLLSCNIQPRGRKIPRCENYFETTVPRYLPQEFQSHFRITPEAFHTLCRHIIPRLKIDVRKGSPLKNPEKQILAVLWLLATPDSYSLWVVNSI